MTYKKDKIDFFLGLIGNSPLNIEFTQVEGPRLPTISYITFKIKMFIAPVAV